MEENTFNKITKFAKAHGFILFVGFVTGRIVGREPLVGFLGKQGKGFEFWVGSYFIGALVLGVAFMLNKARQEICGKGEYE